MSNDTFALAGVILITDDGPSFGTPVFTRSYDPAHYVQSSGDGEYIDSFLPLPDLAKKLRIAERKSNRPYLVGTPFMYGFKDHEGRISVDEKFVLQTKLTEDFDHYAKEPFLAYSIAWFLGSEEHLAVTLTFPELRRSFENDELQSPPFTEINGGLWTETRLRILKTLWEGGLSASEIAGQLGGITRNAVIGKIHRLGLSGRARKKSSESEPGIGKTRTLSTIKRQLLASEELASLDHRVSLEELDSSTCHWPVGDPSLGSFKFCGAPTLNDFPYCAAHSRIAFQPTADPKKRTTSDKN